MTGALIGVAGFKGSGKSEVADRMVSRHGFHRIPLARVLKDMLRTMGLNERQISGDLKEEPDDDILCGKTPRWAMQSLGTEWGRVLIGSDVWVRAWWSAVERVRRQHSSKNVVVDDVRFANEADFVHSRDGILVRVDRPGYEPTPPPATLWQRITGRRPDVHPSERIDFDVDEVVRNDGTLDDLHDRTDAIVRTELAFWRTR